MYIQILLKANAQFERLRYLELTVENVIEKVVPNANIEPPVLDEVSPLPLALIIEDNEDVAHYLKTCLKGKY